jgi:hypothetical protein
MAKVVKELPTVLSAPWSQWTDGQTWQLDTRKDFSVPTTPAKARQAAYAWGRRNGYRGSFRTEGAYTLYLTFTQEDGAA